jgi:ribosomal protein L7/L12
MNLFYRIGYTIARCKYEYTKGRADGFAPDMEVRLRPVMAELRGNHYIDAIKKHRDIFGSSLKDAKDAVDALKIKHGL